jgi:ADP-ribose pyrophosphatase YjhB (NUDIX family)
LGILGWYWSPPGGGVEFGETTSRTLAREFKEETGLEVATGTFIQFHEHIDQRFHALELFFQVTRISGTPILGTDPELDGETPMLDALEWFSRNDIANLPEGSYHPAIPYFLGS